MIENRLSTLLGARRMSIRELATGAGINYGAAHSMYSGKTTRYDADILDKVCSFLGIQVGDLLVRVPDEQGEGEAWLDRRHAALAMDTSPDVVERLGADGQIATVDSTEGKLYSRRDVLRRVGTRASAEGRDDE